MVKNIGLIAGNGRLPFYILKEARKLGLKTIVCALRGEAEPELEKIADSIEWIRVGELGRLVKFFKRENVEKTMMAGKITKTNLFKGEVRPDFDMIKVLAMTKNHSDDTLLGGIAKFLNEKGIELLDSTTYLSEDMLPPEGVLTKRKPNEKEIKDIEYGVFLAKEMGRLDIGQTVVVKNQAILAVEAIEGTDEAIRRGGKLGNGDAIVVKVTKPNQDMRFDVPAVGLTTIDVMIETGAKILVFEAKKTIVLDRAELVKRANENKICLMAKKI